MWSLSEINFQFLLHLLLIFLYLIVFIFVTIGNIFESSGFTRIALLFLVLTFFLHLLLLIYLWIKNGYPPFVTKYEVLLTDAWLANLLFLIFYFKYSKIRASAFIVIGFIFILVFSSYFFKPKIINIPLTFDTIWFYFHAAFGELSVAMSIIAVSISIQYLIKKMKLKSALSQDLLILDLLDEYNYKFATFTYVLWTLQIVTGAIWANQAWARYWSWDPIEVWSLLTWLLYGLYFHMRRFQGLRGQQAALMFILCFVFTIITALFLPLVVNSIHSEYFR
jgi:cytochrome c-type biogenesis protein CcsB